jgi:hypothetical protein
MRHLVALPSSTPTPATTRALAKLLGHKQIMTTITFYADMESAAALKRLDKLVDTFAMTWC